MSNYNPTDFSPEIPDFPVVNPFLPCYGKFDLTTYIQGASDYEIMANLVNLYNTMAKGYNSVQKLSTDTVKSFKELEATFAKFINNIGGGCTPELFGCKGDGKTDDTASLQNMLNFANEYGVACFITSNKEYAFTHLHIPSNVLIVGCGGTLKLKDNTAVDSSTKYYPIECTGSENITLYNVNFNGNSNNNNKFTVCDTITTNGKNIKIDHCSFIDAADSGIMLAGKNVTITHCYIDGSTDAGIYVNPLDADTETCALIDGVTIKNASTSAIALKRNVKKATISNCHISDSTFGITTELVEAETGYTGNIIISNNWISAKDRGIECRGSQYYNIVGNNITGSPAILLRGSNIVITGNTLSSNNTETNEVIGTYELENITFKNILINNNDITGYIRLNKNFIDKVTIVNNNISGDVLMPLTTDNIAADNNLTGSIDANENVVRVISGNILATQPVPLFKVGVTAISGNVEQFTGTFVNAPSDAQIQTMTFKRGMFVFTNQYDHPLLYAKADGLGSEVLVDAVKLT